MRDSEFKSISNIINILGNLVNLHNIIPFTEKSKVIHSLEWLQRIYLDLLRYTEANLDIYEEDNEESNIDISLKDINNANAALLELDPIEQLKSKMSFSVDKLDKEFSESVDSFYEENEEDVEDEEEKNE